MNRIDHQNLSAMTSSVTHDEPVALNLTTGMPVTNSGAGATVPDDVSVSNGDQIIPKPGVKFAAADEGYENLGTVPVTMDDHGDFVPGAGATQVDSGVLRGGQVIAPKPGSKFAAEENFGTVPVTMDDHGDFVPRTGATQVDSGVLRGGGQVIAPKPGSKFAAQEASEDLDECGTMPAPVLDDGAQAPLDVRPTPFIPGSRHTEATVPDDITMSNGSGAVIMPKAGSKFA